MSKITTIARMRLDGTVVEIRPDGTERPFLETSRRPMTDEEFRHARKVPRAKILRRALAGGIRGPLPHSDRYIARSGAMPVGTGSAGAGLSPRDRARP